jgi:Ca-activated chloride channel homolog
MDLDNSPNHDPEQCFQQALEHYEHARWDAAIAVIEQLQADGEAGAEAQRLLEDIRLKRRLEAVQAPAAAPPPRRKPRPALILTGLVLSAGLAVAGLIGFGAPAVGADRANEFQHALVGALPTPAPTVAPASAVAEPALPGTLAVRSDGAQLAVDVANVYLIVDASGSMLARIEGQRKYELAREAMTRLVDVMPDELNVALRTYGQRRPDDCSDTELLTELGPMFRAGLKAQISAITPVNLGRTPMADALDAVDADLGQATGATMVILMSDGDETCNGDPVAAAARLHAARPDLRVSVIGFDIDAELQALLATIAEAGGGLYANADDVEQLSAALRQVLTPSFRVLDAAGREVGGGLVGTSLSLPVGSYTLDLGNLSQPFEVRAGLATVVSLRTVPDGLAAEVRHDWQP